MNKILSKTGKKKRVPGKKNRWEKKQNRLSPGLLTYSSVFFIATLSGIILPLIVLAGCIWFREWEAPSDRFKPCS